MSMERPAEGKPEWIKDLPRWPEDRPFPLSREDCWELLHGGAVEWKGSMEDLDILPGVYEMIDGWPYLKNY